MTFAEAHEHMDLLLDKADQPYFVSEEKDKFLNIALYDWFEKAMDQYDTNPEISAVIGKLVREATTKFEYTNLMYFHNANYGAQTVPYREPLNLAGSTTYGVPVNTLRSLSRYPIARLIHLQVRYADLDGSYGSFVEASKAKSNEVGTLTSDINSDPFNKADDNNVKYYLQGPFFKVLPVELADGKTLSGWRSDIANYSTIFGDGNGGVCKFRAITFPLACNVTNGDMDFSAIPNDPATWGTANCQIGSLTFQQNRDTTTDEVTYSNSPVGAQAWGWPIHICHEIVQNAVRLMTSNIESDNYQNQFIEAQQSKST